MEDRHLVRLVSFLAKGSARCDAAGRGDRVLVDGGERGAIQVPAAALRAAVARGVVARNGERASVTPDGVAWLARIASPADDRFQAQHQERAVRAIEIGSGREFATVNLRESPLASLALRKDRNGRAFLSVGEVEAGERLRADYGFGQIAPRLGANWEAAVSGGRRGGNAKADLSDDALVARQRVDRAIDAVGPELAGILIDVCCFLKGLEQVETERGWPRRSAKLMLKTALGVLARHYQPQRREGRRSVLHWGAADYRPRI